MTDITPDCMAFRRQVGATGRAESAELLTHEQACAVCAAFAERQRRLDRKLQAALQVSVPAELPARIVWRQSARRRLPRQLGVAAGIVLVVALGLLLAQFLPPGLLPAGPLVADVVAHIEHEPDLLLPTSNRAEAVRVNAVLERGGAWIPGGLTDVVHAGLCPFRGRFVPHLVMNVRGEPVSVLVLPDETLTAQQTIHVNGHEGIIVPHGTGSIAILGRHAELLEPVRAQLAGVRWTAI